MLRPLRACNAAASSSRALRRMPTSRAKKASTHSRAPSSRPPMAAPLFTTITLGLRRRELAGVALPGRALEQEEKRCAPFRIYSGQVEQAAPPDGGPAEQSDP